MVDKTQTVGQAGLGEPELQTGGRWVFFGAIWWIHEETQILLQGV